MSMTTEHKPSRMELTIAADFHKEQALIAEFILEKVSDIAAVMPGDVRRIMKACAVTEQTWDTLIHLGDDTRGQMARNMGVIEYLTRMNILIRRGVRGHNVYYRLNWREK